MQDAAPFPAAFLPADRVQLAMLQALERIEARDQGRRGPHMKFSDYRELPDGRRHVRGWAEGVESWLKLMEWQLDTVEEHHRAIMYLATRFSSSKAASGWWRGQKQQHGSSDSGGFDLVRDFLKALVGACGEQNAVEKARTALISLQQKGSVVDYAARFSSLAAELPGNEGPGWLGFLFQRGLQQSLKAIILGKYPADASWTQIRDVAMVHDSVAQDAAAAAAAMHHHQSGGDPMELGVTRAAGRGEDDSDDEHPRRNREATGERRRSATPTPKGACWDCGKMGHFRGSELCTKRDNAMASTSGKTKWVNPRR